MSAGSAYRLRAQSPEFRAAWGMALKEGYERLELDMLERAMTGTPKRVQRGDEVTETIEYPEQIQICSTTRTAPRRPVRAPAVAVRPRRRNNGSPASSPR